MQFIAVLLVSFSMVALFVTLFRKATGGCCTVKTAAVIAAILMGAFAFFQTLAFALVVAIELEIGRECASSLLERNRYMLGSQLALVCLGQFSQQFSRH
ncbi:unnamed protein product [Ectocarpus sp. 4 AP-2014]